MFPMKLPFLCLSTAELYHGKYGNCTTECRFVAHRMQAVFSISCIYGLRIKKAILEGEFRVNLSCFFVVLIYQLRILSLCQARYFYCCNKFAI